MRIFAEFHPTNCGLTRSGRPPTGDRGRRIEDRRREKAGSWGRGPGSRQKKQKKQIVAGAESVTVDSLILLTAHWSLSHWPLFTVRRTLSTGSCSHRSLITDHRSLLTVYCSLFTAHCLLLAWGDNPELLHAVSQGIPADVEQLRSLCLITPGHFQSLPDQGLFYLLHGDTFRRND